MTTPAPDDRPTYRLYVDGAEVHPADYEQPFTLASATSAATDSMTGATPGTRARLDVLAYPTRRGAHAYRVEREWVVDAAGRAVQVGCRT